MTLSSLPMTPCWTLAACGEIFVSATSSTPCVAPSLCRRCAPALRRRHLLYVPPHHHNRREEEQPFSQLRVRCSLRGCLSLASQPCTCASSYTRCAPPLARYRLYAASTLCDWAHARRCRHSIFPALESPPLFKTSLSRIQLPSRGNPRRSFLRLHNLARHGRDRERGDQPHQPPRGRCGAFRFADDTTEVSCAMRSHASLTARAGMLCSHHLIDTPASHRERICS